MNLEDIQAVIESAKARGRDPLIRWVRRCMPNSPPEQIDEAADLVVEIVESVPVFLARAAQEADARHLGAVIHPLLDHAAAYFLRPVDLIPEMTYGVVGLLDDSYLILKILQNLDGGPEPFLGWDLDEPLDFIRSLMGDEVARTLDGLALLAMEDVSNNASRIWRQVPGQA